MAKSEANKETKNPVVTHVVEEFERYEAFHADRFDEAKKIIDMWHNKPITRDYGWQNAVNVPLMVEGEQTISPRLFTALFPTEAPVDVHVEGDAPEEQGIRIKSIIAHYFRVSNVQIEAYPSLVQNTLLGTGYVEGGSWLVNKGWKIGPDGNRYNTIVESRPDCRHVDFFEMYPHPAKRRMDDGLPIIRRRYVDGEALKRLVADSRFKSSNVMEALKSTPPRPNAGEYNDKKEREYELLEYWGPFDDQIHVEEKVVNRQAVPYWCMVVNRKVELRHVPNPYNHQIPPYCKFKMFTDPKSSWFGVGIGTIGKPTQERINKVVNQRLDNVDLVLNKQGCYNGADTFINTRKLQVSKPGQWHKVQDTIASLRWMDIPDVTQSSYREEEAAKNDFREATGAIANLMPEIGSEHRTAMGIQMLQGAAGTRFQPVLRMMETDFIQQLAMFFFSNLKQFMTEGEWVLVTGKNGEQKPVEITPEQIEAKVFFIPTGISETMNKEVQVGQLLKFKEITRDDPTVNRQAINKRIAELMGFKDINELLTPMQMPVHGGMTSTDQQMIQQRLAEGADPATIKRELMGPRPQAQPNL